MIELTADDVLQRMNSLLTVFEEAQAAPVVIESTLVPDVPCPSKATITLNLPYGAKYSATAPKFAQPGTYCFPSGNFHPVSDIGWEMRCSASRAYTTGKHAGERVLYMNCKKCTARITITMGPFITTMVVWPLKNGGQHVH
jgi:hypothetical protein